MYAFPHQDWLGKFMLFTTRWCSKPVTKNNTNVAGLLSTYLDRQFLPIEALWEIRPVVIDVGNWDMHQCGGVARRGAVVAHEDGHLMVCPLLVIQGHPADKFTWGTQSSMREDATDTRILALRISSKKKEPHPNQCPERKIRYKALRAQLPKAHSSVI